MLLKIIIKSSECPPCWMTKSEDRDEEADPGALPTLGELLRLLLLLSLLSRRACST